MDKIFVEGLALRGKHGVHHKERQEEQNFLVDISVEFDTTAAVKSDALADTVDYSQFAATAKDIVEKESFYLIEKLADTIARRILEDDRGSSVEVTVRKPEALKSGIAGVTIVRTRA